MTTSSPIYQNKLQKLQNISKLSKHRAQLQLIARGTQRSFPSQDQYKNILYENSKGQYWRDEREKQISIENNILFVKMQKIKSKKRSSSFWNVDRSHSLNQTYRTDLLKNIDNENKRILTKIISQKPSISVEKIVKHSEQHKKWAGNISKIEKYRLPQLAQLDGNLRKSTHEMSFRQKSNEISQNNCEQN